MKTYTRNEVGSIYKKEEILDLPKDPSALEMLANTIAFLGIFALAASLLLVL